MVTNSKRLREGRREPGPSGSGSKQIVSNPGPTVHNRHEDSSIVAVAFDIGARSAAGSCAAICVNGCRTVGPETGQKVPARVADFQPKHSPGARLVRSDTESAEFLIETALGQEDALPVEREVSPVSAWSCHGKGACELVFRSDDQGESSDQRSGR